MSIKTPAPEAARGRAVERRGSSGTDSRARPLCPSASGVVPTVVSGKEARLAPPKMLSDARHFLVFDVPFEGSLEACTVLS